MTLSNEKYLIEISVDGAYSICSADNAVYYDKVLDPMGIKEHYKLLHVDVSSYIDNSRRHIGIICGYLTYAGCAVLREKDLVILSENVLMSLDLEAETIAAAKRLDIFESTFNIYPYGDDFIIHGECDIARADSGFELKWTVSGGDIFVTRNGKPAFEMNENHITARDWRGNVYDIDYDGNILGETCRSN